MTVIVIYNIIHNGIIIMGINNTRRWPRWSVVSHMFTHVIHNNKYKYIIAVTVLF